MISKTDSATATKRGVSLGSRVKAGQIVTNHNQPGKGMRVRSCVKAGYMLNFTKIEY